MSSKTLNPRPKILVFLGRYLPGFNSGGPVRTISCMVEALAPYFDFYIVTLNRDSGSSQVYTNVKSDSWNTIGMAQVFYTSRFSLKLMERIASELKPDVVYFNGFFSTSSVLGLLKRKLGGFDGIPVVLATRGDLASGALGLKSVKKRIYMRLAKSLGFYRGLFWHASSNREKGDLLRELRSFGLDEADIHVAPDLGSQEAIPGAVHPRKVAGEAAFVTIGRMTRMKNLPFTLERLASVSGKVSLDVFGPLEDRQLWAECEQKIAALPPNVTVRNHGPVDPAGVIGELATRHFFILPTLGENYGHVIVEALAAGCPVAISDRTQWQGLSEKGIGWDIPLEDIERWRSVLQEFVDMDEERFALMSKRAAEYGQSIMNSTENLNANIELFKQAVSMRSDVQRQVASAGVAQ